MILWVLSWFSDLVTLSHVLEVIVEEFEGAGFEQGLPEVVLLQLVLLVVAEVFVL